MKCENEQLVAVCDSLEQNDAVFQEALQTALQRKTTLMHTLSEFGVVDAPISKRLTLSTKDQQHEIMEQVIDWQRGLADVLWVMEQSSSKVATPNDMARAFQILRDMTVQKKRLLIEIQRHVSQLTAAVDAARAAGVVPPAPTPAVASRQPAARLPHRAGTESADAPGVTALTDVVERQSQLQHQPQHQQRAALVSEQMDAPLTTNSNTVAVPVVGEATASGSGAKVVSPMTDALAWVGNSLTELTKMQSAGKLETGSVPPSAAETVTRLPPPPSRDRSTQRRQPPSLQQQQHLGELAAAAATPTAKSTALARRESPMPRTESRDNFLSRMSRPRSAARTREVAQTQVYTQLPAPRARSVTRRLSFGGTPTTQRTATQAPARTPQSAARRGSLDSAGDMTYAINTPGGRVQLSVHDDGDTDRNGDILEVRAGAAGLISRETTLFTVSQATLVDASVLRSINHSTVATPGSVITKPSRPAPTRPVAGLQDALERAVHTLTRRATLLWLRRRCRSRSDTKAAAVADMKQRLQSLISEKLKAKGLSVHYDRGELEVIYVNLCNNHMMHVVTLSLRVPAEVLRGWQVIRVLL